MICATAKEQHCDYIVMGTRGMGKLRRTILGSVSDFVIHHANCPVLVARQNQTNVKSNVHSTLNTLSFSQMGQSKDFKKIEARTHGRCNSHIDWQLKKSDRTLHKRISQQEQYVPKGSYWIRWENGPPVVFNHMNMMKGTSSLETCHWQISLHPHTGMAFQYYQGVQVSLNTRVGSFFLLIRKGPLTIFMIPLYSLLRMFNIVQTTHTFKFLFYQHDIIYDDQQQPSPYQVLVLYNTL